jgi:hypothetical protein
MRATLLLLCFLLLAAPAAGQDYLGIGETVPGELTDDDPTLPEGEHYDVWMFQAQAGATYLITLRSEEFDAYLLAGPGRGTDCDPCAVDDDGALGTDAQLTIQAHATATYVIQVTSYEPGETGTYSLELAEAEPPPLDGISADTMVVIVERRPLVPGVEYAESLNEHDPVAADGAYEDTWVLRAQAGEPVTITMRSDDFDTVLRVGWRAQGRWEELAYDDDGGGGTNSEVVFTPPRDDEYLVLASSFEAGQEGAYTIVAVSASGSDAGSPPPMLHAGGPARGTLEDGDRVEASGALLDVWSYAGAAGETITVEMASDDFDAYLSLRERAEDGVWVELAAQDDEGDGTGSRLTVTLPREDTYAIHASTVRPGTAGAYTLRVRRR